MTKDTFVFKAVLDGSSYKEALALWNQGHSQYVGKWTVNNKEAEQIVRDAVAILNTHWGMQVKPVISWGRSRCNSWGGYGGGKISLAMKRHVPSDCDENEQFTFNEYTSFADSPTVGTFNGTWQDCLRCLVAHEHAHCHPKASGHGVDWKRVYAENRVTLF